MSLSFSRASTALPTSPGFASGMRLEIAPIGDFPSNITMSSRAMTERFVDPVFSAFLPFSVGAKMVRLSVSSRSIALPLWRSVPGPYHTTPGVGDIVSRPQASPPAATIRLRMPRNEFDSWSAPSKLFHWGMALLIFAQIALGLVAVSWHVSPTKLNLFVWHKSLGMLILALLALRLLWRVSHRPPELPWEMPLWER